MASASLRRIVQPLIQTAITTQAFAQVGWSPMGWFRMIVLPGASTPTTDTGPRVGSLTSRSTGAVLTVKGITSLTSRTV